MTRTSVKYVISQMGSLTMFGRVLPFDNIVEASKNTMSLMSLLSGEISVMMVQASQMVVLVMVTGLEEIGTPT